MNTEKDKCRISKSISLILAIFLVFSAAAQSLFGNSIHQQLIEKLHNEEVKDFFLFDRFNEDVVSDDQILEDEWKNFLDLNTEELVRLNELAPEVIRIQIPSQVKGTCDLTFYKVDIYSPNARVGGVDAAGNLSLTVDSTIYYRGILNGSTTEWATLSVNSSEVKLMIAANDGNWNLGRVKEKSYYIMYNDRYIETNGFTCTEAGLENAVSHVGDVDLLEKQQSCPIVLFWLGDFDLFLAHGGNINATTSTLGDIFNNVAALYQQEGVNLLLGSNFAYTQPDGYSETNLVNAFLSFGQNIHSDFNFFGHDLAMFIALDATNTPSGMAVIDAFCSTGFYYNASLGLEFTQGRFAYSRIQNFHLAYPNFSNTINVIAHEMGHNLGSRHTHWCGWPVGAIDNCSPVEPDQFGNSCVAPSPSNGGTIMSYCATIFGSIPFANGFGFYPNQEISSDIAFNDACICSGVELKENEAAAHFTIFPNPSSESLFLKEENGNNLLIEEGIIIDLQGKVLLEFTNRTQIDIEALHSGMYFLVGRTNEHSFVVPWVKE